MRRLFLLVALALVASCVGGSPRAPDPVPVRAAPLPPPPPPAPRNVGEWRDWPLTSGDWVYRRDARGSIALFGPPGGDAQATLRCDAQHRLFLSVRGDAAAAITIRTSSATRAFAARPTGGADDAAGLPLPNYVAVAFDPNDAMLDAMAFSRGRFVIERPGGMLVLPAWAEIGRVIEDCRG